MSTDSNPIIVVAIDVAGGSKAVASQCGVSYQAVYKWLRKGRLPRTDHTGETNHAAKIAAACKAVDPDSKITREALLGLPPVTDHGSPVTELRRRVGEAAA